MAASETQTDCPYCEAQLLEEPLPPGDWIYRQAHYLVRHGDPESSASGAIQIISRRHFIDFAEMTDEEAASFGTLLVRLDRAIRAVVDVERVHLVSTRDRIQHFHAWLYPRAHAHPLRGTAFLAAPQRSTPEEAIRAAELIQAELESTN